MPSDGGRGPLVTSMDYILFKHRGESAKPVLVTHADGIGCVMVFTVSSKGFTLVVTQRVVHWIDGIGHWTVIRKTDHEPAIMGSQGISRDARFKVRMQMTNGVE